MSITGPTLHFHQRQGPGADPSTAAMESLEPASPPLHTGVEIHKIDLFCAIISDLHQHRDRTSLPELAQPLHDSSSYWNPDHSRSDSSREQEQPTLEEHTAGLRPPDFRHCNKSFEYILRQWRFGFPCSPHPPQNPQQIGI